MSSMIASSIVPLVPQKVQTPVGMQECHLAVRQAPQTIDIRPREIVPAVRHVVVITAAAELQQPLSWATDLDFVFEQPVLPFAVRAVHVTTDESDVR